MQGGCTAAAAREVRSRVWADGLPGRATVVSIDSDGRAINDHPAIDFVLDVALPGAPPYQASVTTYISKLAIPRVQPGCEIEVRVDPADSATMVLDPALRPGGVRRLRLAPSNSLASSFFGG